MRIGDPADPSVSIGPMIDESTADAARRVMLDAATLTDVAPTLLLLVFMSAVFLGLSAMLFRWRPS